MNNLEKGKSSKELSQKKAYEPPRAMRLDEVRDGAALCANTGSGDSLNCVGNGNMPGLLCVLNGNGD
jgi:hypothetical protein